MQPSRTYPSSMPSRIAVSVFALGVLLALFLPDWRFALAGLVVAVLVLVVIPS